MTQAKTKRNSKVNSEVNVLSRHELDMNKWWTSLSIVNKENLSGKPYPSCTIWWNAISIDERTRIHDESGIVRSPRNKCKGFT